MKPQAGVRTGGRHGTRMDTPTSLPQVLEPRQTRGIALLVMAAGVTSAELVALVTPASA